MVEDCVRHYSQVALRFIPASNCNSLS